MGIGKNVGGGQGKVGQTIYDVYFSRPILEYRVSILLSFFFGTTSVMKPLNNLLEGRTFDIIVLTLAK